MSLWPEDFIAGPWEEEQHGSEARVSCGYHRCQVLFRLLEKSLVRVESGAQLMINSGANSWYPHVPATAGAAGSRHAAVLPVTAASEQLTLLQNMTRITANMLRTLHRLSESQNTDTQDLAPACGWNLRFKSKQPLANRIGQSSQIYWYCTITKQNTRASFAMLAFKLLNIEWQELQFNC